MYASVAIADASGVPVMRALRLHPVPVALPAADSMQPVFVPAAGVSSVSVYGTLSSRNFGSYWVAFFMIAVAPVGSAIAPSVPLTSAATNRFTASA